MFNFFYQYFLSIIHVNLGSQPFITVKEVDFLNPYVPVYFAVNLTENPLISFRKKDPAL